MTQGGRGGPSGRRTSDYFTTHPRSMRACTSASTKPANDGGMQFKNTAPGNRPTSYGQSTDGPRYSCCSKSWTPTPSHRYDTSVSFSGWSGRMVSCQKSTCWRTKPGTNWTPFSPAFHTAGHPTAYAAADPAWGR